MKWKRHKTALSGRLLRLLKIYQESYEWILKRLTEKRNFFKDKVDIYQYPLKRMLCNTLIQPPFDSACCSRYPNLLMSQKTKLQTTQIFCIRYCLGLKNRSHIGKNELNKINWLTVSNRVDRRCLAVSAHNFKNALSPKYIDDVYFLRISPNIKIRRSTEFRCTFS